MSVVILSKYLEFGVDFRNGGKNWENVFYVLDNCVWCGNDKLPLLQRK